MRQIKYATGDSMWISVEDRLPETIGDYIVFGDGMIAWSFFNSSKKWVASGHNHFYEGITHWQPLPQPPTDEG